MSENVLNRFISENEAVKDSELKQLMHESWDLIFEFLGKENFMRWVSKRELSERIKNMVIEEFSEEDKEKHPNADGFYTRGTDRIKLLSKVLGVNIHETYHFISDHKVKEWFPTYINEGLTEYLNISTKETDRGVSYLKNVQMVKLLRASLGDSLIKAYLTGEIESNSSFINNFSALVSKDGKENKEELTNFYNDLQKMHKYMYSSDKETIDSNEFETINKNIQSFIQNIVVNYIGNKSKNLEYYTDGKLDSKKIKDDLNQMNRLAKDACIKLDFENVEFENEIYRRALIKVIENSHLVVGKENVKEYASDLAEKLFKKAVFQVNKNGNKQKNSIVFNTEIAEKTFEADKSVSLKLADLKLKDNEKIYNNGNFNIAEFISQISNINQKTNMTEIELDNILGNYLLKNCPERNRYKIY